MCSKGMNEYQKIPIHSQNISFSFKTNMGSNSRHFNRGNISTDSRHTNYQASYFSTKLCLSLVNKKPCFCQKLRSIDSSSQRHQFSAASVPSKILSRECMQQYKRYVYLFNNNLYIECNSLHVYCVCIDNSSNIFYWLADCGHFPRMVYLHASTANIGTDGRTRIE